MTPDLSARVAALEAREQTRDVALIRFGNSLSECPESAAPNLAYAIERLCRPLPAAAPPPPAAAPCADEVEVVARAIHNEAVRQHNAGEIDPTEAGPQMARVILAALSPLRQAERERAWREGAEATRSALVGYAEARGARALADAMRAFPLPPMGGADAK